MATSMSDVTSPPGESNAGEESSMDDFVTMGPSNESSLQSPATFRNGSGGEMLPPSPVSRDQLHKRIESLQQQNRVLKVELETYKLRVKALQEENRALRQASVHIQAKAEQEEEFISNTLLKKIQELKKEKENLALNYEQEEECLTNDLSRKLDQLRHEKIQLEHTLEQEQECLVNKLMRRIEKLETETSSKQNSLDNLRREKVELENTLEQEQEALVNKLWKRMDQLETEKRNLQRKLEKPDSNSPPPRALTLSDFDQGGDTAANLANNIRALKQECMRLKKQLAVGKQEHERKMAEYAKEEREIREENLRLQRRLQLEMERREALCRHLSESESSLEMEEERVYNEMSHQQQVLPLGVSHRTRTVSSPVPLAAAVPSGLQQPTPGCSTGRPISPGLNYGERQVVGGRNDVFTPPSIGRLHHTFNSPPSVAIVASPSPPPPQVAAAAAARRHVHPERFVRPPPITSPGGSILPHHVALSGPMGPSGHVPLQGSHSAQKIEINEVKPPSSPMDTSDTKS